MPELLLSIFPNHVDFDIHLQFVAPDHPIKTIHLDNAGEFSSTAFHDYCMSLGIEVQYPVAHTHTQNGLAESFIKHLQWIARPLLLRTKLPLSAWGMPYCMLVI